MGVHLLRMSNMYEIHKYDQGSTAGLHKHLKIKFYRVINSKMHVKQIILALVQVTSFSRIKKRKSNSDAERIAYRFAYLSPPLRDFILNLSFNRASKLSTKLNNIDHTQYDVPHVTYKLLQISLRDTILCS